MKNLTGLADRNVRFHPAKISPQLVRRLWFRPARFGRFSAAVFAVRWLRLAALFLALFILLYDFTHKFFYRLAVADGRMPFLGLHHRRRNWRGRF